MADKPAELPEWASAAEADIIEPNLVKKQEGWVGAERPPAQYFNWLFKTIYLWLLYLKEGLLSGAHTIDGNLTVTGTIDNGSRSLKIQPDGFMVGAVVFGEQVVTGGGSCIGALFTGEGAIHLPIPLNVGDTITTVNFWISENSAHQMDASFLEQPLGDELDTSPYVISLIGSTDGAVDNPNFPTPEVEKYSFPVNKVISSSEATYLHFGVEALEAGTPDIVLLDVEVVYTPV